MPGGFRYCDYNDVAALDAAIGERTCAVLVEPIQGEGGVVPAEDGFLAAIAERCRAHDALLMFDEIQSGLARTGRLFAYQWEEGVVPDVVTIAKALGGGLPIGAMLVGTRAAETLQPGSHGSTFGGNPVAAAVARVVLRKLRSAELRANVERQSERLRKRILALHNEIGFIDEVRGKGLMIGRRAARGVGGPRRRARRGVPPARRARAPGGPRRGAVSSRLSTSPTPSSTTGWTASRPRCARRWRPSGRSCPADRGRPVPCGCARRRAEV